MNWQKPPRPANKPAAGHDLRVLLRAGRCRTILRHRLYAGAPGTASKAMVVRTAGA
jgi:hypothetical protein